MSDEPLLLADLERGADHILAVEHRADGVFLGTVDDGCGDAVAAVVASTQLPVWVRPLGSPAAIEAVAAGATGVLAVDDSTFSEIVDATGADQAVSVLRSDDVATVSTDDLDEAVAQLSVAALDRAVLLTGHVRAARRVVDTIAAIRDAE